MAIRRANLVVGERYKTKIGQVWKEVTLSALRDEQVYQSSLTMEKDHQVLVRTEAGNLIYRSPGQLRRI
jgi:hypothetical protein